MIEVKNLVKKYVDLKGEFLLFENLNFKINEGEFVSIIGPSGCGKTTLLNMIAGFEKPDRGRILINNKEIKGPSPEIRYVFQNSLLFPWKKIKENLMLSVKNNKEKIAVINKILEKFNLLNFANFYPKQLSIGMKQKAIFAQILISNPKIILMDEPFSSLDALTRMLMQEELLRFTKQFKKTVLFVTHDIEEAIFLSDKIIILSSPPTRILKIVKVRFSNSRGQDIRMDKKFQILRKKIFETLKEEI